METQNGSGFAPDDSRLVAVIRSLCVERLALNIGSADEDLFENGVLDSMTLVQLVFELEQHFKVELPLGQLDLASLRSIREMAKVIEARQAEPAPQPATEDAKDCTANA